MLCREKGSCGILQRNKELWPVSEVEEAHLLVLIAQVPVGDGTERHEEEIESSDSDIVVIDEK